jgi:hypothetical protein
MILFASTRKTLKYLWVSLAEKKARKKERKKERREKKQRRRSRIIIVRARSELETRKDDALFAFDFTKTVMECKRCARLSRRFLCFFAFPWTPKSEVYHKLPKDTAHVSRAESIFHAFVRFRRALF